MKEGAPPRGGFGRFVCELHVDDLNESLAFWTELLGFSIAYRRKDEGFVYLQRPEGAQIMLCQRHGRWETGPMERPFGRGVLLQIRVDDLDTIIRALAAAGRSLYMQPREAWRRLGDREGGRREIAVLDPDGYVVMLAEDIGERPLTEG